MLMSGAKRLSQSPDEWTSVAVDPKSKLYRIHHFFLMSGGKNYNIEVQESPSGAYTAHADNTADPHDALAPATGKDLGSCLEAIIQSIETRSGNP